MNGVTGACALTAEKTVWCWNAGSPPQEATDAAGVVGLLDGDLARVESGELALLGRQPNDREIAFLDAFEGATSIARSVGQMCVVVAGEVLCTSGSIAFFDADSEITAVELPAAATKVVAPGIGPAAAFCAVLTDGEVWWRVIEMQ
jgi:hypothetical protein